MGEWYYIGHYGQLGPLTKEQVDELIDGGVIVPETYVWRSGMTQWQTADTVSELRVALQAASRFAAPPPPPLFQEPPRPQPPAQMRAPQVSSSVNLYAQQAYMPANPYMVRSDRSRTMAGVLQIVIPGTGRIYLGYYAYGAIQLVLSICLVFPWLWSIIDGIVILSGGVRFDGFGRLLAE